jgi:hypothetical protein
MGLHTWLKVAEELHGSWGSTWTVTRFKCTRPNCDATKVDYGDWHNES